MTRSSLTSDWLSGWFYDAEFAAQNNLRIGTEIELIIPGMHGRVAVTIEPYFSRYDATASIEANTRPDNDQVSVEYSYFMTSVGLRYYIPVTNSSKFFLNANIDTGTSFNSEIKYDFISEPFFITNNVKGSISAGFVFADRLILEYRYQSNSNLIPTYVDFASTYKSSSLIAGFRILK